MSPHAYAFQSLPQSEKELDAKGASLADIEAHVQPAPASSWKRVLTFALYALGILQVSYLGARYYLSLPLDSAHPKHLGTPCRGAHRGGPLRAALPSHYTLPSGDKIPSVALGM